MLTALKASMDDLANVMQSPVDSLSRQNALRAMTSLSAGSQTIRSFGGWLTRDCADQRPERDSGLFTAIRNSGLRLDSTRAPVEVLVVDRVERLRH